MHPNPNAIRPSFDEILDRNTFHPEYLVCQANTNPQRVVEQKKRRNVPNHSGCVFWGTSARRGKQAIAVISPAKSEVRTIFGWVRSCTVLTIILRGGLLRMG